MIRKLLFIIVDRANYGRLSPLILAGYRDKRFDIKTCFTGTTLSSKFGLLINEVAKDGIEINYKVEIEDSFRNQRAMIHTISKSIVEMEKLYENTKPDAVVIIGDRYEALGCAIAAVYTNKFLIHLQGGEMSSSIDETTRHLITKMAHLHFPATRKAAEIIERLGEDPQNIINSGCPVGDLILSTKTNLDSMNPFYSIDNIKITSSYLKKGFAIACMHPVTTNIENSKEILEIVKEFLSSLNYPIIWITPNADPGSDIIYECIKGTRNCHLVVNLSPLTFQLLLRNAKFALGNSSSFVRDSSFTGTPVLLLGLRQSNREIANNVITLKNVTLKKLKDALSTVDKKPRFNPSFLYGEGKSSKIILDEIYKFFKRAHSKQKKLNYNLN